MSKSNTSVFNQLEIGAVELSEQVAGGVFDSNAPTVIRKGKVDFQMRWKIRARGNETRFDFGKIPFAQAFGSMFKNMKALADTEIHVLWKSHVPMSNADNLVHVSLLFTQCDDLGSQIQDTSAHPTHLHVHHVFYPKNTCNIEVGSILPWAIDINVEGETYNPNYVMADVMIRLKGYAQPLATFNEYKAPEMISLVPLSEPISGILMSRPRTYGAQWGIGTIKRGMSDQTTVKKMMLLQQLGVDIEGADMLDLTGKLLKAIPHKAIQKNPSPALLTEVGSKINQLLLGAV